MDLLRDHQHDVESTNLSRFSQQGIGWWGCCHQSHARADTFLRALCCIHADAKVLELLQLNPDWYVGISCWIAAISLKCLTVL